ncbi:MAG: fibronectin type III domain-containing protein [Opitutaceae bacterium]|nr:fibronectin type III domain-containing protein [Opitutaceae bacterium]
MNSKRFLCVCLLVGALALSVRATLDRDHDGLSDVWSSLHPSAGDPAADPDGDGASNRAEAVAGTDPTSAPSRFAATPEFDADRNLVLRWVGETGKRYVVESTADLQQWSQLPGEYAGTGDTLFAIVRPAGAPAGRSEFWRIVVSDVDTDADGLDDWEEARLGTTPTEADTDHDGLPDAWEVGHGLNPTVDDAASDFDSDGLTNAEEWARETDPEKADTDGDGLNDRVEVTLETNPLVPDDIGPVLSVTGARVHLRADLGVETDAAGNVRVWYDVSGHGNDAVQSNDSQQPQVIAGEFNGRPVVRFDGADDALALADAMAGATEGEIFVVTRLADQSNRINGLCHFGTGDGTAYSYGDRAVWDDFGTSAVGAQTSPSRELLTQAHLFNSSISGAGVSLLRFNGKEHLQRPEQTIGFRADPLLGSDWFGEAYQGDIAEVIVYDRALTAIERDAVNRHLAQNYLLGGAFAPDKPILTVHAVSGTTADLNWSGASNVDVSTVATIERQAGAGEFVPVATLSDVVSFTDIGLSPGETYTYRVTLSSWAGSSLPSEAVTIVTSNVPDLPSTGLRLWLRSTAGLPGAGGIAEWADQSGHGNDAVQPEPYWQPSVVSAQLSGYPVVRFNQAQQNALVLPDLMAGAGAGEAFVVLRKSSTPNIVGLWSFGTGPGSRYPESTGILNDDFATNQWYDTGPAPAEEMLREFHLYNVGGDATTWFQAFNGVEHYRNDGNSVGFRSNPSLGDGEGCPFDGDIAEVIVYDRVLSSEERRSVHEYLGAKYPIDLGDALPLPALTGLVAEDVAPTALTLTWTPASGNRPGITYDIYRDTELVGSSVSPSFRVVGLGSTRTYSFTVLVRDSFDHVSPLSEPLAVVTARPLRGLPRWIWHGTPQGTVGSDGESHLPASASATVARRPVELASRSR